jgi:hypothetical protein
LLFRGCLDFFGAAFSSFLYGETLIRSAIQGAASQFLPFIFSKGMLYPGESCDIMRNTEIKQGVAHEHREYSD